MITSKQRAVLRGMATNENTIFQIGKGGINEEMCRQIDAALEARELIKLRVLNTSPHTSREAADILSEKTDSDVVSVIGSKFVLYRKSKEKQRIFLD